MATKYETIIHPQLENIKRLRRNGATIKQIADDLGVGFSTLKKYRKTIPELDEALNDAELNMQVAMANLAEASLFDKLHDRLLTVEIIEEETKDESGVVVKSKTTTKRRLVQADLAAISFALKNRLPELWNTDEHNLSQVRLEKLSAEIRASEGAMDLGTMIQQRLASYSGGGDETE